MRNPKRFNRWSARSFTMMELLVVFFVIALIAAFTIPNYNRSREKEFERQALINLRAIYNADLLLRARTGAFWPGSGTHVIDDINTDLRLGIIQEGLTYSCRRVTQNPVQIDCTATRTSGGYTVVMSITDNGVSAVCSAGTCPTCTAGACPGF